jgi:anti-sigma regulatory factor (Ser/Thr protein kinase)
MAGLVPVERPALMAADWFAGTPEAVGQARRFVAGVLGEDCPRLGEVLLLVSEIATNAVRHTASGAPGGWFDLTVSVTSGLVRVTVTDRGSASEPRVRHGGKPGEPEGGRGLLLVEQLADKWGSAGGRKRRVVWFEMRGAAQ